MSDELGMRKLFHDFNSGLKGLIKILIYSCVHNVTSIKLFLFRKMWLVSPREASLTFWPSVGPEIKSCS